MTLPGSLDKVSPRGVLHKASGYGVRGRLYNWLESYLKDRQLPAAVNGHLSTVVDSSSSRFYYFTRGVPTGCAFLQGTLGDVL